jgi:ribosome-associated translation inhibitor RaiA
MIKSQTYRQETFMQTPLQIDFQGMKPTEALRTAIAARVAALEDRFGRVTACRIVLKSPGEHHRTGGLYEVNIRLALPDGKEVNVGHTPSLDERHADVEFALNDAFKRARRQLQDQVRRLQGHVKTHEARPAAVVEVPTGSGVRAQRKQGPF